MYCKKCGHEEKDSIIIKEIVNEKVSKLIGSKKILINSIKTKKIIALIVVVISGFMLFNILNNPEKSAKKFVEYLMQEEISQAIEMLDTDSHVTNGIVNTIINAGEYATSVNAKKIYKENNFACVRVVLSGDQKIVVIEIALVKNNGKWNISEAQEVNL